MTSIAAEPDETLESGYLATTPSGDNFLLDYSRAEASAFSELARTGGGRVTHDQTLGLHLTDLGLATPFGNVALLCRPVRDAEIGDLARALRTFYGDRAGGPYLLFSPWPIADLSGLGLKTVGHPPLMFRPAGGSRPDVDGFRIVEVNDADTLADFEQTLIEAYPVNEMQPWRRGSFLDPSVLDTAWHLLVGYDDNRAVATAAAFVSDGLTVVELVSTRAECRGRGYGAALTAAAALTVPAQPSGLISSDHGRRVYEQLGYLPIHRHTLWLGTR